MNTGDKIAKLRKENNYTQEQLAELLGVSRQSISKYESGLAYPETEKLIRLGELFDCSLDFLLKDEIEYCDQERSAGNGTQEDGQLVSIRLGSFRIRERKSKRTLWGLPLWHIARDAKGIIAIGLRARGIIAVGMLSLGVLSFGLLSLGVIAIGAAALGALAIGCLALGGLACGSFAFGVIAIGAIAIGEFTVGALAVGHYFAYGDYASAMYAFGETEVKGSIYTGVKELSVEEKQTVVKDMLQRIPSFYHWMVRWFSILL